MKNTMINTPDQPCLETDSFNRADVCELINKARYRGKPHEINRKVSDLIYKYLLGRGVFYKESEKSAYYFTISNRLIPIDKNDVSYKKMIFRFDICESDPLYKHMSDYLEMKALSTGDEVVLHRFCHYDKTNNSLYVTNNKHFLYKITKDIVDKYPNGHDGVLFVHDPVMKPYEYISRKHRRGKLLLSKTITNKISFASNDFTIEQYRIMLNVWVLSLFFPELLPTRPILALVGGKGTSKTTTIKSIGTLLYGDGFNVTPLQNRQDDFDAVVTNKHFVGLDNADSNYGWLPDRLAVAATGGNISKRELYKTNVLAEYAINSFIAITSREPHFKRDDVAERLWLIHLDKPSSFIPEGDIINDVIKNRDYILSEFFDMFKIMLSAWNAKSQNTFMTTFRMADFARFAHSIPFPKEQRKLINEAFVKMSIAQSSFSLEDEEMVPFLNSWCKMNESKIGIKERYVSSTELCRELSAIARGRGSKFSFENREKAFSMKLSAIKNNLESLFDIKIKHPGGNRLLYSFKRNSSYFDD